MRQIMLVMLLGGVAFAQTMVDSAAAAAGGSVGAMGGKKVSDGISRIFDKEDKVDQPAVKIVPVVKERVKAMPTQAVESVPAPPRLAHHAALHKPIARTPQPVPATPPQPTEVIPVDLRTVTLGMARAQVLELGEPTSRMMTSDDGHLMEVYRYALGVVRLTDGAVSSIDFPE